MKNTLMILLLLAIAACDGQIEPAGRPLSSTLQRKYDRGRLTGEGIVVLGGDRSHPGLLDPR